MDIRWLQARVPSFAARSCAVRSTADVSYLDAFRGPSTIVTPHVGQATMDASTPSCATGSYTREMKKTAASTSNEGLLAGARCRLRGRITDRFAGDRRSTRSFVESQSANARRKLLNGTAAREAKTLASPMESDSGVGMAPMRRRSRDEKKEGLGVGAGEAQRWRELQPRPLLPRLGEGTQGAVASVRNTRRFAQPVFHRTGWPRGSACLRKHELRTRKTNRGGPLNRLSV